MNRTILLIAAVAAGTSLAAHAQALKQRKPGLWELRYSVEGSEAAAEAERMRKRLESMTPEKRAQMEAAMEARGMGLTLDRNGVPTMMIRFCLTPQDVAQESSLLKGAMQRGNCQPKVVSQSATEVKIHAACAGESMGEVDARIYDIAPDHYAVDFKANGARGNVHMLQNVRWLGADCKGAAF